MAFERYQSSGELADRRRRQMWVVVVALLMGCLLALGFYLGQSAAYSGLGVTRLEYRQAREALAAAEQSEQMLREQVEIGNTRHEVDRAALEMVRQDLAVQNEQIAALEETVNFYRGLVAPVMNPRGLVIAGLEVVATVAPTHFAFRIVAKQESRKFSELKGKIKASVFGQLAGEAISYPLAALSEQVGEDGLALKFRYFQLLGGELVLPEGFEPEAIEIVATASAPRKMTFRERYPWQVQVRFTHVGE